MMKQIPSVHFNDRPAGIVVDTIVIHSMHAPQSADPCSVAECATLLDHHKVSAHFIIDQLGAVTKCVEPEKRAWHAGESKMPFSNDLRVQANDFSIGIELIAPENVNFTEKQYKSLQKIISDLALKFPISTIVGHEHIAPGRKTDPGANFDWKKLKSDLKNFKFRYPDTV